MTQVLHENVPSCKFQAKPARSCHNYFEKVAVATATATATSSAAAAAVPESFL